MVKKVIGLVVFIIIFFSVSVFADDGIVNVVQKAISYLNAPFNELTQDEEAFLKEMKQIKLKLSNLDELENKKHRLDYEKIKLEQQKQDPEVLEKELLQIQQKLAVIERVEKIYDQLMPILLRTYTISTQLEEFSKDLTKENIKEIRRLKQLYESSNYPQRLLEILGLDQVISIQTKQVIQTTWNNNFIQEVFIKTAYADTDPTGGAGMATDIFCPPLGAYDMAVGFTGLGLDTATWIVTLGDYDEHYCSNVASWVQVDSNVNRFVNACGLSEPNHVLEKAIEKIIEKIIACFKCLESEGEKQICNKCCKIKDKECICEACGHGTWNGKDCDCEKGYEKVGDDCCGPGDEECKCKAKGKQWNFVRKVCCDKTDKKCQCLGDLDDKQRCCEGGKWDNGLCCKNNTYNSNGHCCRRALLIVSADFVWDGKECVCPSGTKNVNGQCCNETDEECECIANFKRWDRERKVCCEEKDKKCDCLARYGAWDDELGCCTLGKWDNGLCCRKYQHNSNGHCCREGEEWSEYSSGIWPFNSSKGSCCTVGSVYNGTECACKEGEEKTNGHCCEIGYIWIDGG